MLAQWEDTMQPGLRTLSGDELAIGQRSAKNLGVDARVPLRVRVKAIGHRRMKRNPHRVSVLSDAVFAFLALALLLLVFAVISI
jgi:hypothetical protein